MIQVGQTIGNYKVTAKLGEGGMGVVYLAEHPVIGRKVAMKAIHPELSKNEEVVSRFMTEAKSVNQIGNEHIVDISDFGTTEDGEFYFVMEFLQGEALADRLKRERVLQPPRALQIAAQVADALSASHVHGIVHRDLKPENIFLITRGQNPDFVKVLDFGLAKLTQGEEKVTHKTRTGSVMGTPFYMAPEQCEGKASIDHRADIYSLGVILFEMLTGTVPFTGEGYGEIIVKHITQPAPAPRSLNPGLTAAHEAVLLRALAKSRAERFQSMEDLRAAILDPERYLTARSALATSGTMIAGAPVAVPAGARSSGATALLPAASPSGTAGLRLPTAFEHAGALDPQDLQPRRGAKPGLVAGLVVGAIAVAGAALVLLSRRAEETPPAAAVTAPRLSPVPVGTGPAAKSGVTFRVTSTPPGAVVRKEEDGKFLGETPFEVVVPRNSISTLVFQKDGYERYELPPVIAEADQPLQATLKPLPVAPVVKEERPGPASSANKRQESKNDGRSDARNGRNEGRSASRRPPSRGASRPERPPEPRAPGGDKVDPDDVLPLKL